MRYTFKNKVVEQYGAPQAVFDMWEMTGILWFKKRVDRGEVTYTSTHLDSICEAFERGESRAGANIYSEQIEDQNEFRRARDAVQRAWQARNT